MINTLGLSFDIFRTILELIKDIGLTLKSAFDLITGMFTSIGGFFSGLSSAITFTPVSAYLGLCFFCMITVAIGLLIVRVV